MSGPAQCARSPDARVRHRKPHRLRPLTNVAIALALEPSLPDLITDLVVVGVSPGAIGNMSSTNVGRAVY
jgi:hypothetical protein